MKRTRQITVLLADDNAPIRQGLRTLLDGDAEIRVVAEARNGREAVEMAQKLRPHVILMDISMPVINGLEATRQIMAGRPASRIIVLSAHVDDEYVGRARELGAVGFLAKQLSAEMLTRVIHEAAMGRSLRDPIRPAIPAGGEKADTGRVGTPRSRGERLTFRESEVLELIAGGLPKTQIAERLHISAMAVERHFGALMAKLGIPSLAKLVAYAIASVCVGNDVDLVIT